VGIAQEEPKVGSYDEFRRHTLPRIADAGYNAIQLMALMEHPYYGSFGYHVANFFASSSRFGTPEDLKALIDDAHGRGLRVIMDLVHSHAAKNEAEGLSRFDGTPYQYFHSGDRGDHEAWDSRCFDYQKPEVLHFLLSNCRYWLDEFRVDGFRFDGVTSMLYTHHGLGVSFGNYDPYFDAAVDEDAYTYLALANQVIHQIHPHAITIAEDVSGMPGLGAAIEEGGCGFDARMAMGIPDHWFRLTDQPDESWDVETLWHQLTDQRLDERTISYVESHDQALVGGKSFLFQLIDAAIYDGMACDAENPQVDRGVALHKLARLLTLTTSDAGYLTFIGNEFGHPEWIDFPREGNHWSYHYARRQWSLRDNAALRFHGLAEFDRAILALFQETSVAASPAELLYAHGADQVLVASRGDLVLIFNFHPTRSHSDYALPADGAAFSLLLDSDAAGFAGHSRLEPGQRFVSLAGKIQCYLPTRTALVLKREKSAG
jgi:1,4-alpha-glucan branching enzyme